MRFSFWIFLSILLFANAANASFVQSDWASSDNVKARILIDNSEVSVEVKTDPDWHIYYKDPGEAGWATEFDFSGSRDFEVQEVIYPEYELHEEYGIKTNVYHGGAIFPVDGKLGAKPYINLNLKGAVCNQICVPFDMQLSWEAGEIAVEAGENVNAESFNFSIIITAFLAGLLLNIMPCVLPVLSLKVLSVIKQVGKERAHARMNFLSTSAGIITSFLVLAAGTAILKSAGHNLGWGLHFQSPIFVGLLTLVTFIFALSLFGVFHLRVPSWISDSGVHKDSMVGNFLAGVLATLLGTACTAPVLVTAVSFALAGSVFDIFLIFTIMGVGMAFPYLLFAANPNFANFLPKPGKWMNTAKQILGLLLLLTSLWLGSILYGQLVMTETSPMGEAKTTEEVIWYEFDEEKIPELVEQGKVVFVDITASWCVNCQANKIRVLATDEIEEIFAQKDVITMRGDMTKPQKHLLEYIKKYNRYGIPFNAVYGTSAPEGILLEPLLSKDAVKAAVEKAR